MSHVGARARDLTVTPCTRLHGGMPEQRRTRQRRDATGGTCIYCLETKGPNEFRKVEHVLPQSFGRFSPANLVLRNVVCDDCNQHLGDELELYLARDTPDGLNRFLIGGKDPADFKSLGARTSLLHRADDGPLKGALVTHRIINGGMELTPLPQVGFGRSEGGPYDKWFLAEALPDGSALRGLARDGFRHVHFCEVLDVAPILAELRARGMEVSEVVETRPAGWKQTVRVETVARLAMPFGRAITKIAFNYLAHEYGPATALMPEFETARRFVRRGGRADEHRLWSPRLPRAGTWPLGHSVSIEWDRSRTPVTAVATVSLHHASWYTVTIGSLLIAPPADRAHFFDLKTMTVHRLR